jgi:HB1, ASXL, restriction endonuclease HTH domain
MTINENDEQMTLHEAILRALAEHDRHMTAVELAEEINRRQFYIREDGAPLEPGQINARVASYPSLFERSNGRIGPKRQEEY